MWFIVQEAQDTMFATLELQSMVVLLVVIFASTFSTAKLFIWVMLLFCRFIHFEDFYDFGFSFRRDFNRQYVFTGSCPPGVSGGTPGFFFRRSLCLHSS